jgi:phage gp36-like protein
MPYASQIEIQHAAGGADRLIQLADWDADGVIDAAVIAAAQEQADAFLDSYLRLRYATPVANPSATLRGYAAEHAVYWMRQARGMTGPDEQTQLENRQRQLEAMRDGKLRPDEPLPAKSTAVRASFRARSGDVSRDKLKGAW